MRLRPAPRFSLPSLLALAIGALLFTPAHAQPPIDPGTVQLRWDACYADGGGDLRTFACDTNSGSEVLVVTATPAAAVPQFNGFEASLYVILTSPALPSWWQVGTGFCRPGSSVQASFTPPAGATNCVDHFAGAATGGTVYTLSPGAVPNLALVRIVAAIAGSAAVPAGQNIFLARVLITHSRSTGSGSCAGCSMPAGIGLERVRIDQTGGVGFQHLLYPNTGTDSDFVHWQSSVGAVSRDYQYSPSTNWHKSFTITGPTRAQRPTWGAIKSLYR